MILKPTAGVEPAPEAVATALPVELCGFGECQIDMILPKCGGGRIWSLWPFCKCGSIVILAIL